MHNETDTTGTSLDRAPGGFAVERLAAPLPADDGHRVAVIDGETSITYAELDRAANQVANGLRSLGLGPNDRVAFVGRNCLPIVELQLGTARAGVVLTILNWRLHPQELAYVLADSAARVVITTTEFEDTVRTLPELAGALLVLVVDGSSGTATARSDRTSSWTAWRNAQAAHPVPLDPSPDDVVLQLYTSGTTGKPKGAMLTRASMLGCIPDTADLWQVDPSSVVLSVLPMFHIAGAGTSLATLWARACLVIDNDARPAAMLAVIDRHGVTNLILASVMLQMIVDSPASSATDLSRIRTVSYGAAPITGQVLQAAIALFQGRPANVTTAAQPTRIVQAYGLTETTGVLCVLEAEDHRFDPQGPAGAIALGRLRSCGRPRSGVTLRIIDVHTGEAVAVGQPGEVQARTARLMSGYWNLPEATAEALLPGGWFRTGDIGYLDADGYLFLGDRLKDMIVSGGENVYPAEVEDALQWHPEVAEVAVIGVPDDKWGETPRAIVVRTSGSSLTADELIAFARGRLAGYKCPTACDFVDELPRNATGKVLRRELREPYWVGRERRIN